MDIENLDGYLLEKASSALEQGCVLIDVGAFHGDFTKTMLETGKFSHAFLFEPNPENASSIETAFGNEGRVTVIRKALGNKGGKVLFHCDSDPSTGSALEYDFSSYKGKGGVTQFAVETGTLDGYLAGRALTGRIGLIKTDTQGYDLRVLEGGRDSIAKHRPIVAVEMIFVPLYAGQAAPHEIIAWMAGMGYSTAGVFNEHYTSNGWLAFADFVFVPVELTQSFKMPFVSRPSSKGLEDEVKILRGVCEERLELINLLHNKIHGQPSA